MYIYRYGMTYCYCYKQAVHGAVDVQSHQAIGFHRYGHCLAAGCLRRLPDLIQGHNETMYFCDFAPNTYFLNSFYRFGLLVWAALQLLTRQVPRQRFGVLSDEPNETTNLFSIRFLLPFQLLFGVTTCFLNSLKLVVL